MKASVSAFFPEAECLNDTDYRRLAALIQQHSGIRLPPAKKTLLESRLRRRLQQLSLESFEQYCHLLFEQGRIDDELGAILNLVTTNKTDFFREPHHFDFLAQIAMPTLLARGAGADRPLRLWSAACANGAEPYTLAMVCQDFADATRGFRFEVLASDICTDSLRAAHRAIYPHAMVQAVPMALRQRYLLRSRSSAENQVRIVRALRHRVSFSYFNLMDDAYPVTPPADIIFCRNVLIYFDKETQKAVVGRLCRHLREHGYLFLGHSESIAGFDLPLSPVAPTVFRLESES